MQREQLCSICVCAWLRCCVMAEESTLCTLMGADIDLAYSTFLRHSKTSVTK